MPEQPTTIVIPAGAAEVTAGLANLFADELDALDKVLVDTAAETAEPPIAA